MSRGIFMTDERNEEMEERDKPKFKLVDKRRINIDDVEASDGVEEEETGKSVAEESSGTTDTEGNEIPTPFGLVADEEEAEIPAEFQPPPGEEVPAGETPEEKTDAKLDDNPLAFTNIIISILHTLATVILVDLGLVPHPQTQLVAKKLEEARKAIELFQVIFIQVKDDLPEELAKEFERALADLKANYVNQL
jgi:hypothetical protein